MTPDRWQQVARVYHAVLEQAPADRGAYLASACAGDAALRAEVESLLAQDGASIVVDKPIAQAAGSLLAEPAVSLAPGTTVGPYRIVDLLGVGGMGEVYRAHDIKLGRDVALKILPDAFVEDPDRRARFTREAHVLASLNHPHIAAIYGFEDSGAVHALVLELVEGPTLADRIAQGPLPVDEALGIARQIAEALEAAHEHSIIHRDLKPANIKVREDGTVKVLDFGLAKLTEAGSASEAGRPGGAGGAGGVIGGVSRAALSQSPTIMSPAMTGIGVILGTAAYMSPEQAKGKPADKRSDIWAFGCVLFEMLTGRRAFAGDDVAEVLASVIKGEPPWEWLPADLPVALRVLLQRMLERSPHRRVSAAATAQFVLTEHPRLVAPAARSLPQRSGLRNSLLAIGVATAAVVAAAAWVMTRPAAAPPVVRFAAVLPAQVLSLNNRTPVALSPGGTQAVYAVDGRFYLKNLADFDGQLISGVDEGSVNPIISPDGSALLYYGAGALKRVALTGGSPLTLCTCAPPYGLTWDEHGILFGRPDGAFLVPPAGGEPQRLLTVKDSEWVQRPQLLPGGQWVLFTLGTADGPTRWDTASVVVQSIETGTRVTLVERASDARYLPTGHLLYARGGTLFAVAFDAGTRTIHGREVAMIEGVRRSLYSTSGDAYLAWSPGGTLAYVPGPATVVPSTLSSVIAVDAAGKTTQLLPPGAYVDVRVSADGRRLAVSTEESGQAILWAHDLDGTMAPRRLTFAGHNTLPAISRDGRRVAYQSDREGDFAIFVQPVDGGGDAQRVTRPATGERHIPESWSPDGSRLAYSVFKDDMYSLHVVSIATARTETIPGVSSREPTEAVFSPDGKWLLYASSPVRGAGRDSNRGVFLQPFPPDGRRYQVPKTTLDFHPTWGTNGREVLYVASAVSGNLASVTVTMGPNVSFGVPKLIGIPFPYTRVSSSRRGYDRLPDGRFVVVAPPGDPGAESRGEIRFILNWNEELKARVPVN